MEPPARWSLSDMYAHSMFFFVQRSQRGVVPEHCGQKRRGRRGSEEDSRSNVHGQSGSVAVRTGMYLDLAPATFSARDGRAFAPDDRLEQAGVKLDWAAGYIRDRQ